MAIKCSIKCQWTAESECENGEDRNGLHLNILIIKSSFIFFLFTHLSCAKQKSNCNLFIAYHTLLYSCLSSCARDGGIISLNESHRHRLLAWSSLFFFMSTRYQQKKETWSPRKEQRYHSEEDFFCCIQKKQEKKRHVLIDVSIQIFFMIPGHFYIKVC